MTVKYLQDRLSPLMIATIYFVIGGAWLFSTITPFEPANYDALKKLAGTGDIQKIIDSDDDGFISLGELKKFNGNQALQNLSLQGIINPETVTHDLKIMDNRWDCTFCHASGPGAMQTSFLALPREDGGFRWRKEPFWMP